MRACLGVLLLWVGCGPTPGGCDPSPAVPPYALDCWGEGAQIRSDDGLTIATVGCLSEGCRQRRVVPGSELSFVINVANNAAIAGRGASGDATDYTLETESPEIIALSGFAEPIEGCSATVFTSARLHFRAAGVGTVRLLYGEAEQARFTFEAVDAAFVEFEGTTRPGIQIGRVNEQFEVTARAYDRQGRRVGAPGALEYSIDDPLLASFDAMTTTLTLNAPGRTHLRARVQGVEAVVALVIVDCSYIDEDAGNACDPDFDAGGP